MDASEADGTTTAWLDERYRQVIEQVEDYAVFTLDNHGTITTWNEGAERVLGFSEAEALGQPASLIFTPEDREQEVPEQELETARSEGRADDERWHVRRDGSRFYASGVVTALFDRGKPDGFSKILCDRTEQVEAEAERKRLLEKLEAVNDTLEQRVAERTRELEATNGELQRSQRRFAQAFQLGPVATCLTTLGEERFLDVNDAFLALTGYAREEVVGRTAHELGMWSSHEDLRKVGDVLAQKKGFRELDLQVRHKDGGARDVLLSAETIRLDGHEGYLKMFYDVTDRKRTEEQTHRAIQEVMSDTNWFSQRVMERLAQIRTGGATTSEPVELTRRERDVLERLARGVNNEVIAAELGVAVQTVRNYISAVYDKLGVRTRAEAIVWARERGIVG